MVVRSRLYKYVGLDALLLLIAVLMSHLIRFDGHVHETFWESLPLSLLLLGGFTYFYFYLQKVYLCSWRHAGIRELMLVFKGTTLALLTSLGVSYVLRILNVPALIPTSVLILTWMTATVGISGSRLILAVFGRNTVKMQPHHKKALVVGAGSAGKLVVEELLQCKDTDLYPVAFIDDDPKKQRMAVLGITIVGTRNDIQTIVQQEEIDTIIIAMPSIAKEEVAKIISICKETRVNIKILPLVRDVINGKVTVNSIRDVNLEDLLGRDSVDVNLEEISLYLRGKTVLVTGAGGSIGSELCRQISAFEPGMLLLLGHGENSIYSIENELRRKYPHVHYCSIIADIQDRVRIDAIFQKYSPAIVFHAAAHKHVPLMENNIEEAIKNNIFGTKNLAECAHKYGAERFVCISTDKAVNPTSVMGVTKRIAEMMVQSLGEISTTKFAAVRFGNVLGSRGSVIPLFKQQINEGGPVTITHPEMLRFFMTISEAVQLVIQAGALTTGGEVFILDMGKPVRISDLANDLIRLSGLEPNVDIKIVYTGMRPGEKLYEEIFTSEESATASKHNRIFIGNPSEFSYEDFTFFLRKLEQTVQKKYSSSTKNELLNYLHQMVPTYQSPVPEPQEALQT
ncbi:polysaccharide biosynthesis protein [Brevibacillus sp. 179-C9.3 HS]|uniref:polysaccharide biosynthesis protein n=1 Tax=unclassified Brevibacillus TaxID=2684853 RepID=UPI0039A1A7C6